jgi:four helix bundle protein
MSRPETHDLNDRTFNFSRRIIHLFAALPNKPLHQTLGRQVLRSGTSVGANYREAFRARSRQEFRAKIGDCLKEIEETSYWLQLLESEELIKPTRLRHLLQETKELIAIFVTIRNRTKTGEPASVIHS